jgi:23S rRNA (guanosine2251-2'-O)-methyltransferase
LDRICSLYGQDDDAIINSLVLAIFALMRKLEMEELNRKTVDQFKTSAKFPLIVVLDNVRSMHNVGSVFRTADAFLLEGVYLCGYTPKPPHRDIQKTALGATDSVDWKYFQDTGEAIRLLTDQGYTTVAVEQVENSISLKDFSIQQFPKLAVVFGNEVSGVGEEVLKLCSASLEIPQFGMKHSLNIAVAAGIVLWELVRDRV